MNIIRFLENLKKNPDFTEFGNQVDRIRRRHADTKSIGLKASVSVIFFGIIALVIMTLLDFAMLKFQPVGFLKGLLSLGYFLSMITSLLIIYGLFELIKIIFNQK